MKDLKKKQKILNFLSMQFGVTNPYHYISDLTRLEDLSFDPYSINLESKIQANILDTSRLEAMPPNDYMAKQAQLTKLKNEKKFIEKSKKNIDRWERFRQNKAIVVKSYIQAKKK